MPDTIPLEEAFHSPESIHGKLDNYEVITDKQGFRRTVFKLGEGKNICFRGVDELPDLLDYYQPSEIVLLSSDESPYRTSTEDFISWRAAFSRQERAEGMSPNQSHESLLLATATPRGIIDAAITLAGENLTELHVDKLKKLRENVTTNPTDEGVIELLDDIFAAGVEGTSREVGLFDVVKALVGDQEATERVISRRQRLRRMDLQRLAGGMAVSSIEGAKTRMKEPGEKLSKSELEILRKNHLVGVHTTKTDPRFAGGGLDRAGRIFPRSHYNLGGADFFPRATIHWSINHPVESHVFGNFESRPFTVVAPLADLVEENGAPAVINEVDTYFSCAPGEALDVPQSSIIIGLNSQQEEILHIEKGFISLRSSPILPEDLRTVCGQEIALNSESKFDRISLYELIAESDLLGAIDYTDMNLRETVNDRLMEADNDRRLELEGYFTCGFELLKLAGLKSYEELYTFEGGTYGALFSALQNYMALDAEIAQKQYPNVGAFLTEPLRRVLVRRAIAHQGGKNIRAEEHSGGGESFQKEISQLRKTLGIKGELHHYSKEMWYETAVADALKGALLDQEPTGSERSGDREFKFNWEKYRSEEIWDVLLHYLDDKHRRTAVMYGLLTWATPPTENQPQDTYWLEAVD